MACLAASLATGFGTTELMAAGKAEHVVVLVWDGMRPDFITPQFAPNLYSLATNGVFFKRHHPVYISSTEVNGTALATGMHPGESGIIANTDYRPEFSLLSTYATEGSDPVWRGDLLSDGKYVRTATLAEMLQDAGIATIIAGSKPVALLHDRSLRKQTPTEKESITLFEGKTLPRSVAEALAKVNDDKVFPTNVVHPNTAQDSWTTKALTRSLWRKTVPKYTLLWLSEPDKSQHEHGPGSSKAVEGIESSDKNLGEVIKTLKEKGVYDSTDIFVVSDHGFSTIEKGPNIVDALKKVKFTATKKFDNPEPGDVMVIGLGGSVMFYVFDRDEAVIRRLVTFLQTADFTGVVFSRLKLEGTFPLETVRYPSTNNGPDVVISLRWHAGLNEYGTPGMFQSAEGTKGKGSHASLSPFDMNNTLVAAGPDLKKGMINELPSGNIDLAPTVLWILGVKPSHPLSGRVLHEALSSSSEKVPAVKERRVEASVNIGLFRWEQYLKFCEIGDSIYFDEGNGQRVIRAK
jgi:arylsulfatase A-like enzyme